MKHIYETDYIKLGLKIAYYRKLRGFTQEQLAEKIDRTAAYIGHIEAPNIAKAISLDTLFDISRALSIPPYKFLVFDDEL
ncbi:MAG: helix-turn-helix transcriptional regulator [Clostridia bacterium]|nr:helix-turn-helix transcriptional regulator [Clostridia bacterium]